MKTSNRSGTCASLNHGESGDADTVASEGVLPRLRELISNYSLKDVFNADECRLFYSMAPDRKIAQERPSWAQEDERENSYSTLRNSRRFVKELN